MPHTLEAVRTRARVSLTPLHRDNLYTHFRWNNDPELHRLDSEQPFCPETLRVFKRRFEAMIDQPAPDTRDFEIHAEDGTLIGVACIFEIRPHHRHCKIGLTLGDRAIWGQGYGREALQALLDVCFLELGMHRVSTETFAYNEAWRRLIEGVGFQHEGTVRDYLFRDDRFYDKHTFALLEDEYQTTSARAA